MDHGSSFAIICHVLGTDRRTRWLMARGIVLRNAFKKRCATTRECESSRDESRVVHIFNNN